jgi:hypothetical protein
MDEEFQFSFVLDRAKMLNKQAITPFYQSPQFRKSKIATQHT